MAKDVATRSHALSIQVNQAELRHRILTLSRQGASSKHIADLISRGDENRGDPPLEISEGQVRKLIKRYLEELAHEDQASVDALRVEENERLNDLRRQLYPKIMQGDLKAMDRFLRLSERYARMNGLDAPQKVEHDIGDGLKALGLEAEHVKRAQEAFEATFEEDGIADVELVGADDSVAPLG